MTEHDPELVERVEAYIWHETATDDPDYRRAAVLVLDAVRAYDREHAEHNAWGPSPCGRWFANVSLNRWECEKHGGLVVGPTIELAKARCSEDLGFSQRATPPVPTP